MGNVFYFDWEVDLIEWLQNTIGSAGQAIAKALSYIGGESACLRCMQKQELLTEYYPGENSFLDRATWHLFAFFIIRTLYYIKDRNLYYLLSDAQIPINKVMTISRDDITAKMRYLHRDVSCACSQ